MVWNSDVRITDKTQEGSELIKYVCGEGLLIKVSDWDFAWICDRP